MKLSECLSTADITTLREIADHYSLACSRHSKLALLQEILFCMRGRQFLAEQLSSWQSGVEYPVLRLCLETRTDFSAEELNGLFQKWGGETAIRRATMQGWLYPTTRLNGRLMYIIPQDLRTHMRQHIVRHMSDRIRKCEEGPLLYHEEGFAMIRDCNVFLEYVRNHTVNLTREGSMYKRNLVQVLELLEVSEEPLTGGWRFGYGRRFHDYPDRFALLYDYAYQKQLIREGADGVLTITDACADWYGADEIERQRDLVRFYISLYRRAIHRLPQVIPLLAHVAVEWIDSADMLRALEDFIVDYYYDNRDQVWQVRILKMLMHLGVLRLGEDENSSQWFQITNLGQQLLTPESIPAGPNERQERHRILIVQPNFDIVVTGDQPLITAELALFTELRQAGAVRVYRLSEASVKRGMETGKSLMEWLTFIQRHSQTPVPGNVERTLLEWARAASETDTLGSPGSLTS